MSYQAVRIQEAVQARSVREDLYLRCRLHAGERTFYATCWDDGMFAYLNAAKDRGEVVTLDIVKSDKIGPGGQEYLNIVGYEHPGQTDLFRRAQS